MTQQDAQHPDSPGPDTSGPDSPRPDATGRPVGLGWPAATAFDPDGPGPATAPDPVDVADVSRETPVTAGLGWVATSRLRPPDPHDSADARDPADPGDPADSAGAR